MIFYFILVWFGLVYSILFDLGSIISFSEKHSQAHSWQRDTSKGAWFQREELPKVQGKPIAKAEPTGPTDGGASGAQVLPSCAQEHPWL